jgi:carboxyl-terminal processing protease
MMEAGQASRRVQHSYAAGLRLIFLGAAITTIFLFSAKPKINAAQHNDASADAPADAANTLSLKDRIKILDDVWKDVRDRYYDPEFHGVNWEEAGERYRPQVAGVKSDQEFYALVNRMTGELHDAHTRFNSPGQWENRKREQGFYIGFFMTEKDGKMVINDVHPDSNAARMGIEPGMIVLTVNGRPIAERIAEAAKTTLPSSTERITRVRVYSNVFSGPPDKPFQIGLQRADGSEFTVSLTKQVLAHPPDVQARLLPSGDLYIRFDGFQDAVPLEFKQALEKFKSAPGLIVDLRQNGGGKSTVISALASYFFNEKTVIAEFQTRKDVSSEESSGSSKAYRKFMIGNAGGQLYAGPIVVLTDDYTGSSSEIFAGGLQETGRAKVAGTQSCGCVIGIANNQKMKGGGVLEISEVLFFTPKGRKLEGEGVIPDLTIAPTIADLQQKRDAVLEQAEELLKTMSNAQAPK